MSRNIFQSNTNSNNIFANNNNNSSQSNIFTRNQQSSNQNNNIFTSQNNSGSSNNIFNNQNNQGYTQGNNQQGNNIFNNNQNQNQNQGANIFNRGNTNQGNNIFNNNQSNNLFNNNQNQGNNIFNNQGNNQGNNLFNNNNQQGNNIFSQNNQNNNNIFTQNNNNNQNRSNNYQPIDYQYFAQQPIRNILRCTPQQQMHLIRSMNVSQTRRLVELCIKGLVDPMQLQRMSLSDGNFIKNIKVKDVAAKLNIKKELLFIKKQVKDNVISPIAKLKRHNDAILKAERQLSQRLQEKLLDLKQKLLQATTESKIIQQLKEEIEQIDNQIKEFLKAQFYQSQGKTTYKLVDPDPFCIKISQRILQNITVLDDKMDQLIACEAGSSQQSINISETIEQIVEYYENVAIQLKDFSEKFKGIKRDFLSKRRSSYDGSLDHIKKKSIQKVEKEMHAYNLLKDIEKILQQREKSLKQQ